MTVTRSTTGKTPRKSLPPDFVETPARQRKSRTSKSPKDDEDDNEEVAPRSKSRARTNGSAKSPSRLKSPGRAKSPGRPRSSTKSSKKQEEPADEYEFGGPIGVTLIMISFPLLMYYMWLGATFYDGKLPLPNREQGVYTFFKEMGSLVYQGAFPTLKAWAIYWSFFTFAAFCYLYMPGIYSKGKALPHENGRILDYYCSGLSSWYLTIILALGLHFSGLFPLYTLIDEFGPIMSVAIITGFLGSFVAYGSAMYRGATHRMTGNHVYDFFMGAELNPRLLKWLDFKMFFEVRIPWFMLFLTTLGACTRQHEQLGYVSGELGFLLMAHFLYANACCKGEELIPPTWDMYHEKLGFMLIFWNLAGVPLSYCHASIYLANTAPHIYRLPRWALTLLFVSYLFAYWVWDTCGSQKNNFRHSQRGNSIQRSAFPQLPWRTIKNPETIPVKGGDDLLCDGWYKYARKIHYTADMWFAICWALVCGFQSPFPWFYPIFFGTMIAHRARRDIQKCKKMYGKSWEEFERRTPYLFIPYVF